MTSAKGVMEREREPDVNWVSENAAGKRCDVCILHAELMLPQFMVINK